MNDHHEGDATSSIGGSGLGRIQFTELPENECLQLLAARSIGRIAWTSTTGPIILPVSYVYHRGEVVLRTSPDSDLAELAEQQPVALEVDFLDEATRSGWSILLRGICRAPQDVDDLEGHWVHSQVKPWAPGDRPLFICITPWSITGRSIVGA